MNFQEAYKIARGLGFGPLACIDGIEGRLPIRFSSRMEGNHSVWRPDWIGEKTGWSMLIKAPDLTMKYLNKKRTIKYLYFSISCEQEYEDKYELSVYCGDVFHPHRHASGEMCTPAHRAFRNFAWRDFGYALINALDTIKVINPDSLVSIPQGLAYCCRICARKSPEDRYGFDGEITSRGYICKSCNRELSRRGRNER